MKTSLEKVPVAENLSWDKYFSLEKLDNMYELPSVHRLLQLIVSHVKLIVGTVGLRLSRAISSCKYRKWLKFGTDCGKLLVSFLLKF